MIFVFNTSHIAHITFTLRSVNISKSIFFNRKLMSRTTKSCQCYSMLIIRNTINVFLNYKFSFSKLYVDKFIDVRISE